MKNVELLIIALTEFFVIYFGLLYVLSIRPTLKLNISYVVLVVLPTFLMMNALFDTERRWIFVAYFIASASIYTFYYFRSHFAIIHLCVIYIGCVVSQHITAYLSYSLDLKDINIGFVFEIINYCLINIIFIYTYGIFFRRKQKYFSQREIMYLFLLFILLATVVVFLINTNFPVDRSFESIIKLNLMIQIGYLIICLILFALILYHVNRSNLMRQKEIEAEQFTHYMTQLEKVNQDMYKFRHEYNNILITIKGYIDENDMEGLNSYFQQHIVKFERQTLQNNLIFSQLKNLESKEIKGLLATKLVTADNMNIDVHIEVPDYIDKIKMDILDLSRVLGNLLDNALEASQHVEKSEVNIAIMKSRENHILIIIQNKIDDESINVSALFTEHYSTKGENRGMGLAYVQKIINKYPNVTMNTRIENKWFIQELEIKTRG